MAFTQTIILLILCLFGMSGFVQESSARGLQLTSGRSLAQDDNNGEEGNEGNEGFLPEGEEARMNPGEEMMPPPPDGQPEDAMPPPDGQPEDMMPPPPDGQPEDMMPPPDDGQPDDMMPPPADGQPEDMMAGGDVTEGMEPPTDGQPVETAPAPEAQPEETMPPPPEEMAPAPEDMPEEIPPVVPVVLPGEDAAVPAVVAVPVIPEAMAPVIVPGDAMGPSDAPASVGTRDFAFGDVGACSTLRDGLTKASPALQTALEAIAPLGDGSPLSAALDDPAVNVTVLLPNEELLNSVASALASDTTGTLTPQTVQDILLDHILTAPLEQAELVELGDGMLELVSGDEIEVMIDGTSVMFTLNNITATVTEADVDGCAGQSVIHRIDNIFADIPAVAAGAPASTDTGAVDPGAQDSASPVVFAIAPAVVTALSAVFMLL